MKQNYFQEKAKRLGKSLFIESFTPLINPHDIEVYDKPKLIESADGTKIEGRGVLREVDITRFVLNQNNRRYPKPLWENVYKSGFFEGSLCLADHPDDDGSTKDIVGVWRNLKICEDTCKADLYVVGELGQRMIEIAQLQGKVGFSTVGFGELLENGIDIDPETYEYERTDWVLNPSQLVYATFENIKEKKDQSIPTKPTNYISEKINKTSITETTKGELSMSDKFLIKTNIHNQTKAIINESKENPARAYRDLHTLYNDIPDEFTEEKMEVKCTIDSLKESIQSEIENKSVSLQEALKTNEDLTAKYDTAVETITKCKETIKELEEKVKKVTELEDDNKIHESNSVKMLHDIEQYEKDVTLMERDIKLFKRENEKLKKRLDKVTEHLKNNNINLDDLNEAEDSKEDKKKNDPPSDENDRTENEKDEKKESKQKNEDKESSGPEAKSIKPVEAYYEAQVTIHPGIKEIKESILRSETMLEAIQKINKFNESIDNKPILVEQKSTASWKGNRL